MSQVSLLSYAQLQEVLYEKLVMKLPKTKLSGSIKGEGGHSSRKKEEWTGSGLKNNFDEPPHRQQKVT